MIKAENITFAVKDRVILEDVSVSLDHGEVLVILGPNGAGKSSLLKCLTGSVEPTEGCITYGGRALAEYTSAEKAKFRAVLSQKTVVSFPFTGREIVMMGRNPHILHRETYRDQEIIDEILAELQAEKLADQLYSSMSGGEQQRIQFARVLAQIWDQDDAFLFLDEPTAALDLKYQIGLLEIARNLAHKHGFGVCTILHDLRLARVFGDRSLMLKNGHSFASYEKGEDYHLEDICALMDISETSAQLLNL